jgi:hypothetical protein
MIQKVKNSYKSYLITILFFIIYSIPSNGQNQYSLNNMQILNPSGNSNLSLYEFQFIADSSTFKDNCITNFSFKPSSLGFSEIKQLSGVLATNILENSIITIGTNYFGFDLFNEFSANISYARNFEKLWLGTNFSLDKITVKDFNSENLFKIDIFGKLHITDKINVGFFLKNLNRAHYSNSDKTIHQNLIISFGFLPLEWGDDGKIKLAADFGTNLNINRNSFIYISTLINFYDLVGLKAKIISNPLIVFNGVSLTLTDWLNLSVYFRYQKNFSYEQTYITEFYW